MNENTKVTFRIGTGLVGSTREDTYTLKELGFVQGEDFNTKEELEELLDEFWEEWSVEYIDGGFSIEEWF